jgi:hypothetical protein
LVLDFELVTNGLREFVGGRNGGWRSVFKNRLDERKELEIGSPHHRHRHYPLRQSLYSMVKFLKKSLTASPIIIVRNASILASAATSENPIGSWSEDLAYRRSLPSDRSRCTGAGSRGFLNAGHGARFEVIGRDKSVVIVLHFEQSVNQTKKIIMIFIVHKNNQKKGSSPSWLHVRLPVSFQY